MLSYYKLPVSLRILVRSLFIRTLRCYLPDLNNLRHFVINAPPANMRYYCTLIRHVPKDRDSRSKLFSTYVLYLEYLGGLIPILKGKRTSKLKPEFIIYDPQSVNNNTTNSIKEMFVFENYLNATRRSSTKRIAYYVPTNTATSAAPNQRTNQKIASYLNGNLESTNSESEDDSSNSFQLIETVNKSTIKLCN